MQKLEMLGKAQHVARPVQTSLQNLEFTGPKFLKFLSEVEDSSPVLTRASVVECQSTE